jgi:hypothetical protein
VRCQLACHPLQDVSLIQSNPWFQIPREFSLYMPATVNVITWHPIHPFLRRLCSQPCIPDPEPTDGRCVYAPTVFVSQSIDGHIMHEPTSTSTCPPAKAKALQGRDHNS